MTHFVLKATAVGYTFEVWNGKRRLHIYDENGGHGLVEKLYGQAERVSHELRAHALKYDNPRTGS